MSPSFLFKPLRCMVQLNLSLLYISVSLSLSPRHFIYLSFFPSLFISFFLSVTIFTSLSPRHSIYLSFSPTLFISLSSRHSLYLSFSLSLYISLFLFFLYIWLTFWLAAFYKENFGLIYLHFKKMKMKNIGFCYEQL